MLVVPRNCLRATLKLFLLGPLRVEVDDQPLTIRRRKALALLVYLAVSGQTYSRDALAALRQYEEYVRLLGDEFSLPPEEETATLYEAIKARRMVAPLLRAAAQEAGQDDSPIAPPRAPGGRGRNCPIPSPQYASA